MLSAAAFELPLLDLWPLLRDYVESISDMWPSTSPSFLESVHHVFQHARDPAKIRLCVANADKGQGIVTGHTAAHASGKMVSRPATSSFKTSSDLDSVVFSFWTSTLDLIENALDLESISFIRFDGKLSNKQRGKVLSAFRQDDSVRVALLTISCGAVGYKDP